MSTVDAKRYIQLLSPAGYGRPIYQPEYANGPFLRLGDIWIESGNGRSLLRLMNTVVPCGHFLNTHRTRHHLPSDFKHFPMTEEIIIRSLISGPIVCGTYRDSKERATLKTCPQKFNIESDGSVHVEKCDNQGAMLTFQPPRAAVMSVEKEDYKTWIIKNIPLIIEHGIKNGYKEKFLAAIRIPTRIIHAESWAWTLWYPDLPVNLDFKIVSGVETMFKDEARWGYFPVRCGPVVVGPSDFYLNNDRIASTLLDPQNRHSDANEHIEAEGKVKESTSKTPNHDFWKFQEIFSYPFKLPNSHTILYDGYKFKHQNRLKKRLSNPFRRHKQEEGSIHNGVQPHHVGQEIDASDDPDDIVLTYLLVCSPENTHIAMLHTTETQTIYDFAEAKGCSITAALKAFSPEIVVSESGNSSDVRVASFAYDALRVFTTKSDWESLRSTDNALETSWEVLSTSDTTLVDMSLSETSSSESDF